jgi:hypothetical protein
MVLVISVDRTGGVDVISVNARSTLSIGSIFKLVAKY